MRRALGLDGRTPQPRQATARSADPTAPAGRHRHRFVSDGEVPVVLVQSRPDMPANGRLDAAAAAAAQQEERAARERAERSLSAAQATIRDLQTKLAHATLARDEAVAALHAIEQQVAEARAQPPAEASPVPPVVRRRGRPPKSATAKLPAKPRERTPRPVKWWVKGWQGALSD